MARKCRKIKFDSSLDVLGSNVSSALRHFSNFLMRIMSSRFWSGNSNISQVTRSVPKCRMNRFEIVQCSSRVITFSNNKIRQAFGSVSLKSDFRNLMNLNMFRRTLTSCLEYRVSEGYVLHKELIMHFLF